MVLHPAIVGGVNGFLKMLSLLYLAPCTLHLVPCTLYLVPCTLYVIVQADIEEALLRRKKQELLEMYAIGWCLTIVIIITTYIIYITYITYISYITYITFLPLSILLSY